MGKIKREVFSKINEVIARKQKLHNVEVRSLRAFKNNRVKEVIKAVWEALGTLPTVYREARANYRDKCAECRKRHVDSILERII